MKIAFVSNQQYMRGVDVTAATVFELGEPISEGDELRDVVTGQSYKVASRGFAPKRSAESASRSHWSSEASVTLRGKCKETEKRLLFAGEISALQCVTFTGNIEKKTAMIPSGVPIVGLVTLKSYDAPGILLVDDDLHCELLTLIKREPAHVGAVRFSCLDLSNASVELTLDVTNSIEASDSGPLLHWQELDCAASMV